MTKAELQQHAELYRQRMERASELARAGLLDAGLDAAVESLQYVDGMMRFEARYNDAEFASVSAVDFILRRAPLLLSRSHLDALGSFLAGNRRVDKVATDDLSMRLRDAYAELRELHRLYELLRSAADVRQDELRTALGGNQDRWRSACEFWQQLGIVTRTPSGGSYRVGLATSLDRPRDAKCWRCGHVSKVTGSAVLEKSTCAGCGKSVELIVVAAGVSATGKD